MHFYSSGAIEEEWTSKDLGENFLVAAFGSGLGTVLTIGLLVLGVLVILPNGIVPELLISSVIVVAAPFGKTPLVVGLLGTLACLAGATIETELSGGYSTCQFFNWRWGQNRPAREVPRFTVLWMGTFAVASGIELMGVEPLQLVNASIIFGMVIMPFTYYPILRVAGDRGIMGEHVNSRADTVIGTVFMVLITVAAIAAIPLMILTRSGQP